MSNKSETRLSAWRTMIFAGQCSNRYIILSKLIITMENDPSG
jgi:hypothetical protein